MTRGAPKAAAPSDKKRTSWLHIGIVVALILVVGAAVVGLQQRFGAEAERAPTTPTAADLAAVSGQGQATPPPWPAPVNVAERVEAAGLTLGPMGTAEHYHPELSITVDGEQVPIPANIGVDPMTGQMAAVHTHTPDGVVHIEAARKDQPFTLGQLFTLWNVRLTQEQIGAVRAEQGERLSVTVNGDPATGNPAHLLLAPNQRIHIAL